MSFVYTKAEVVSLKDHSTYNEFWVRDKILEDPTILGLGEVEVKAAERQSWGSTIGFCR